MDTNGYSELFDLLCGYSWILIEYFTGYSGLIIY